MSTPKMSNNNIYRGGPRSYASEEYQGHRRGDRQMLDAEAEPVFRDTRNVCDHGNRDSGSFRPVGSPPDRSLRRSHDGTGERQCQDPYHGRPQELIDADAQQVNLNNNRNNRHSETHPTGSPDRFRRNYDTETQPIHGSSNSHHSRDSGPPLGSPGKALRSPQGGAGERSISGKSNTSYPRDDNLLFLQKQGFPKGLAQGLIDNNASHPVRFWVVDNSGSMMATDGQTCMLGAKAGLSRDMLQVAQTTRWAELQESVAYHAKLSASLQSSTIFRFLNDPGPAVGPQEFSINQHGVECIEDDLEIANSVIRRVKPGGSTPLTQRIVEIRERIKEAAPRLRQRGQHAVIILATDGIPTNEVGDQDEEVLAEFIRTLKSLQSLPIWIVVRLCTDERAVVEFYNDLDSKLELPIDVLDDFFSEAKEVYKANEWLNYSLHLHRLREHGCHNRLFDLLDERKLTKDELLEFLIVLFGENSFAGAPSVHSNWKGFLAVVSEVVSNESKQWNPITKSVAPWIDLAKLEKCYGKRGFKLCGC